MLIIKKLLTHHMEKVVLSIGGSVIVPGQNDVDYLRSLAALLSSLADEYRMIVVCGGGRIARYYIQTGRELGGNEEQLDWLGIKVTRLNAALLQMALGEAAVKRIPECPAEAIDIFEDGKIVVMGGTEPGHTTDAVAAMVASEWGAARIVNATSIDAVYSDDPKKVKDAVRYSVLTFEEFYDIVNKGGHNAGQTAVFDRKGASIAMRAGIPISIVYGRDLEELERAIRDLEIHGTKILNTKR